VQDTFDPAVLRSGRFGMQIQFETPDREGREQLFAQYLKSIKPAPPQVLQAYKYHHQCYTASGSAATTMCSCEILLLYAHVLQQLLMTVMLLSTTIVFLALPELMSCILQAYCDRLLHTLMWL
jgi:SpoVK/Ycf46/Vps4 family AAA+-type ATPase